MIEYLKKVLEDASESPSTKRLIAMVGSVVLFLGLLISIVLPIDVSPSPALVDGCVMIICVALGSTVIEKFSKV